MNLFTFSGVGIVGPNNGGAVRKFARDLVVNQPNDLLLSNSGREGIDHWSSSITGTQLLQGLISGGLFEAEGFDVLNRESVEVAGRAAVAIFDQCKDLPDGEPILLMGHSQGTNNLAFTIEELLLSHRDFVRAHPLRCLMLDTKVARLRIERLFGAAGEDDINFLFIQSEEDVFPNVDSPYHKFIDLFPSGDHYFVMGKGHGDIRDWDEVNKKQRVLDRKGYEVFAKKHLEKSNELDRIYGNRLTNGVREGARGLTEMTSFRLNYKTGPKRKLSDIYYTFFALGEVD